MHHNVAHPLHPSATVGIGGGVQEELGGHTPLLFDQTAAAALQMQEFDKWLEHLLLWPCTNRRTAAKLQSGEFQLAWTHHKEHDFAQSQAFRKCHPKTQTEPRTMGSTHWASRMFHDVFEGMASVLPQLLIIFPHRPSKHVIPQCSPSRWRRSMRIQPFSPSLSTRERAGPGMNLCHALEQPASREVYVFTRTGNVWYLVHDTIATIVGGFNPSEKYESVGMIIPNIWKNEKCSKPPTRQVLEIL